MSHLALDLLPVSCWCLPVAEPTMHPGEGALGGSLLLNLPGREQGRRQWGKDLGGQWGACMPTQRG